MEGWTNIPWPIRMVVSLVVMAVGGILLYSMIYGYIEITPGRRSPLMVPGLLLLGGVILFAHSFPQDGGGGKYNF